MRCSRSHSFVGWDPASRLRTRTLGLYPNHYPSGQEPGYEFKGLRPSRRPFGHKNKGGGQEEEEEEEEDEDEDRKALIQGKSGRART